MYVKTEAQLKAKLDNDACPNGSRCVHKQVSAPKLSLLSPRLQIPMENIEMSTHFLTKQRRTHNE